MDRIDDDLKAFLIESNEELTQIEADLLVLERDPEDQELMHRIYRVLHTLKGNCGFLGLTMLEAIAHGGETLLSRLRDRQLSLTPEIISALLNMKDAVQIILANLESTGQEGEAHFTELRDTLDRLQAGEAPEPSLTMAEPPAPLPSTPPPSQSASIPPSSAPPSPNVTPTEPAEVRPAPASGDLKSHAASFTDSTIRVQVALLDKLVNLVGELVLCRNQILEFANSQSDSTFVDTAQRLNLVTTELQEGVMKTRMQPIRNVWGKLPRLVRDLCQSLNKQVHLEMVGEDTELDKTLLEAIADPLIHLVRNCIDHGLESPQTRLAAGKPAQGQLLLRAAHESGYVTIEISDDGAGIDVEQLKLKALEHDHITLDQAANMSDQELLNLIFLPGFSMAERVTNLSGRGVGMDVVRTNIEEIGGTIDVYSQRYTGTTFKLKIPLTLAIIPTLVVTCGTERYAIPQVNLLELVRLEGEQAHHGVEMVHGAPVYRLRGHLLPLVYLKQELGLDQQSPRSSARTSEAQTDETFNIVVLQTAEKPFGLVVDAINDSQEIVVKPLGKQLKGISCYAGATIMGDGHVALILDVPGLAQRAHMVDEPQEGVSTGDTAELQHQQTDLQTFLLCQGPDDRRLAIPLSRVARLEQFNRSSIEQAGNQDVLQYRQQILPLLYLSTIFAGDGKAGQVPITGATLQVVVISTQGDNHQSHNVGLVVEQIRDIVAEQLTITSPATQHGIACTAVVQNKIMEILDIEAIAAMVAADQSSLARVSDRPQPQRQPATMAV